MVYLISVADYFAVLPDLWYVGVLSISPTTFQVAVGQDPRLWQEVYVSVCDAIVRAKFVSLADFNSSQAADNFADTLRAMEDVSEWVAQSNPHLEDISHRWTFDLFSGSTLFLRAYIRHLQELCNRLSEENLKLRDQVDRLLGWKSDEDDGFFGEGGVACPVPPRPPSRSPGNRCTTPTEEAL